jgi:type I restriction enzyme, S subunit
VSERLKWMATLEVRKGVPGERPILNLENVVGGMAATVGELNTGPAGDLLAFEPGDVLFSKLRPYLAKSLLVAEAMFGSGEFLSMRPGSGLDPRFLMYVTLSAPWLDWANMGSYGTKMPRTSWESMRDFTLPWPGLDEQYRIANYLDSQVSLLDRAVELCRQEVSLTQEAQKVRTYDWVAGRRTSIRGFDRQVSWLGQVPETWAVGKFRRVANFHSGTTFPHEFQGQFAGDLPVVKVSDFARADAAMRLDAAENWVTAEVAKQLRARVVPAGSVVFARVGAALLLNARRILMREAIVDDNVRGMSFDGDARYFLYLMTLLDFGEMANPGPVPSIGETQIAAIDVPIPPVHEQTQIADALDHVWIQTDRAVTATRQQVDLLLERRRAIITAAVTGQFDVTTAGGAA